MQDTNQNTSKLRVKLASAFFASQVASILYYLAMQLITNLGLKVSVSLTLYQTSLFIMVSSAIGILFYELWNWYFNK